MPRLSQVGEFGFIEEIARLAGAAPSRGASVGIGDDAAVVRCSAQTLLTTDTQREGVHFELDWLSARQLGRRAFRVAVSDIAAMGGEPRYVLLSLGAPARMDADWMRRMVAGLIADAGGCGAALVGGNMSADEKLSLVVTVVADASSRPVLRSAAKVGDQVWVTGPLGAASAGVELLGRGVRRHALLSVYRTPPLRVSLGRALASSGVASAMIDVSDGLVQDLGHLCLASEVSVRLDTDAVPVAAGVLRAAGDLVSSRSTDPQRLGHDAPAYALGGGDDYELVFTARSRTSEHAVRSLCARHESHAVRIGTVVKRHGRSAVHDAHGRALEVERYQHFGSRR
jgi:thiamine-monophosphate kinase